MLPRVRRETCELPSRRERSTTRSKKGERPVAAATSQRTGAARARHRASTPGRRERRPLEEEGDKKEQRHRTSEHGHRTSDNVIKRENYYNVIDKALNSKPKHRTIQRQYQREGGEQTHNNRIQWKAIRKAQLHEFLERVFTSAIGGAPPQARDGVADTVVRSRTAG